MKAWCRNRLPADWGLVLLGDHSPDSAQIRPVSATSALSRAPMLRLTDHHELPQWIIPRQSYSRSLWKDLEGSIMKFPEMRGKDLLQGPDWNTAPVDTPRGTWRSGKPAHRTGNTAVSPAPVQTNCVLHVNLKRQYPDPLPMACFCQSLHKPLEQLHFGLQSMTFTVSEHKKLV